MANRDGKRQSSKKLHTNHTTVTVPHHDEEQEDDHESELTAATTGTEPSTVRQDFNKESQDSSHTSNEESRESSRTSHQESRESSRTPSKLTLDEEVLKEDALNIATYVKEEMYYGIKFLYDPKEDLAIGNQIFNHFYRTCRKTLQGLKKYGYDEQEKKELYIRYLWKHALDERIQQDALSTKRSSVYTVMQNRFFCK